MIENQEPVKREEIQWTWMTTGNKWNIWCPLDARPPRTIWCTLPASYVRLEMTSWTGLPYFNAPPAQLCNTRVSELMDTIQHKARCLLLPSTIFIKINATWFNRKFVSANWSRLNLAQNLKRKNIEICESTSTSHTHSRPRTHFCHFPKPTLYFYKALLQQERPIQISLGISWTESFRRSSFRPSKGQSASRSKPSW